MSTSQNKTYTVVNIIFFCLAIVVISGCATQNLAQSSHQVLLDDKSPLESVNSDDEIEFYALQSMLAQEEPVTDIDAHVDKGLYQEAAWEHCKNGEYDEMNILLTQLEKIMRSSQLNIRVLGGGISSTYLVGFPKNVKGVFKLKGTDLPTRTHYIQHGGASVKSEINS